MLHRRPCKRYGILDDFGEVIRWVWDRPVGRAYITQKIIRYTLPEALF